MHILFGYLTLLSYIYVLIRVRTIKIKVMYINKENTQVIDLIHGGLCVIRITDRSGVDNLVTVPQEGLIDYLERSKSIQECFPGLDEDTRELFISGINADEWDEMFN